MVEERRVSNIKIKSEMPEGPEAYTISSKLKSKLVGKYILDIHIFERAKHQDLDLFHTPALIQDVVSYGKRPLIITSEGIIATFLGMTGKWLYTPGNHSHIHLDIGDIVDTGVIVIVEKHFTLYYEDHRYMGKVTSLTQEYQTVKYFSEIGPDLIRNPPTSEAYLEKVRSVPQKMQICVFLLEQSYFSGVGNYIKSEVMYYSGIKPDRTLITLTDEDIERIRDYTVKVMNLSVQHGGLTISDYWAPEGEKGTYPKAVYGNKYDPQGRSVIKSVFGDNRTTHWVPDVQI